MIQSWLSNHWKEFERKIMDLYCANCSHLISWHGFEGCNCKQGVPRDGKFDLDDVQSCVEFVNKVGGFVRAEILISRLKGILCQKSVQK